MSKNANIVKDAKYYMNDAQSWYSFYWWINFYLFWGIPIFSTLLASNAFASIFPAKDGVQSWPLVIMTILLSIMTIINSSIKPKDQYEKNAGYRIRFEQYDSTYDTEEKRISLQFNGESDFYIIINEWKEFKKFELFDIIRAYLTSESVPAPRPFVYNGRAIYPSVLQPAVAAAPAESGSQEPGKEGTNR